MARREILQRGRTRVFAITMVILLTAVAVAVSLPAILSGSGKAERVGVVGGSATTMTGIVTEAGRLAGLLGIGLLALGQAPAMVIVFIGRRVRQRVQPGARARARAPASSSARPSAATMPAPDRFVRL